MVKNGDKLVPPENPVCKEDADKQFQGWSADKGKTVLSFKDLNTEIRDIADNENGEEIDYYAVFDNVHTVTFYGKDGKSIISEKAVKDGTVVDPSEVKCEVEENSYINSWTQDPDYDWSKADSVTGETSVTVTKDIAFYPIIKGVTWVFFDGNAGTDENTYIAPIAVKWGDKLTAPDAPSRRGYTFKEWTTDKEGEYPYNFDETTPASISKSVVRLFAQWEEAKTTYTIEIWVEACKDGNYIASPKNYKKKYSFRVEGETGKTLDPVTVREQATAKEKEYVEDYTDKRTDFESLQYRDINVETSDKKNENVIIKGDGSTTAYVYYDMRTYEFQFAPGDRYETFKKDPDWLVTFEADGKTYTYSSATKQADGTLIVQLHPGEYTSNLPHDIKATNKRTGEVLKPMGLFTWYLEHWNQNKMVFTDNTLYSLPEFKDGKSYVPALLYWPKSVNRTSRWSNIAFVSSMADFTIHYFKETLNTGEYEETTKIYSDPSWYNWYSPSIKGFRTLEPDEVTDDLKNKYPDIQFVTDKGENLLNYKSSNSRHEYYFFLNRCSYNLYFYNDGRLLKSYTNPDEKEPDHKIKYQASFGSLLFTPEMPEKYKSGDYEFKGWSTEGPDGAIITSTDMPASDVTLYAVWQAKKAEVQLDANGGTFSSGSSIKSLTLSSGQKITEQSDYEIPERDGYQFLGWAQEGGSLFSADTLVYHNLRLIARWVQNGNITIRYDDQQGNITDSGKWYSEAAYAKVDCVPKSVPNGKLFIGWNYDGVVYANGQSIVVLSRNAEKVSSTNAKSHGIALFRSQETDPAVAEYVITLKAEYTDAPKKLSVTYDPNGGKGGRTYNYTKHAAFSVANADEADVSRSGYHLIGWNTEQDGSGNYFEIGSIAALDEKNPFPNVLYAVWGKDSSNNSDDHSNDEGGPGAVSLYKVDGQTGAYVPGATFALYQYDGTYVGTYTTDKNGCINVSYLNYGSYYFTEIKAPDGYVKDPTHIIFELNKETSASPEYPWNIKFTNNKVSVPTIMIGGTKTWDDNDNAAGARPKFINLHLLANGREVGTATAAEENGWRYSFGAQATVDADGKTITYTVTEDPVADYTTTIAASVTEGNKMVINVTNTYNGNGAADAATAASGTTGIGNAGGSGKGTVETGDDSHAGMELALLLFAAASFAGWIAYRKRRDRRA